MKKYGVPPGKRVLNTHISLEEHAFLKREAARNKDTITHVLRDIIRAAMSKEDRSERRIRLPYEMREKKRA